MIEKIYVYILLNFVLAMCHAMHERGHVVFRSSHRDSFRKYLFFFSRSNLFIIFQEGLYVLRTDTNFPEGLIEKTCFFKEVLSVRRTDLFISSNRMILIFPELQKPLFSPQTHTNFPGASILSSNTYDFPGDPI